MRPFSQNLGALERLPVEVLTFIVINVRALSHIRVSVAQSMQVQHTDFKSVCTLRLTCKAFDTLAGPLAFSSLSFVRNYRDNNHGERLIALFRELAAGSSPYSRWAQTLLIDHDGLYPYLQTSGSYEKKTKKMLEDRAKLLVPAMESLTNLKRVRYVVHIIDA